MRTVGNALSTQRLSATIAIVDIDHFSHLNDLLGHPYGHTLLKAIASRMIGSLVGRTVVSRLAADTFGILGRHEGVTLEILLSLFQQPSLSKALRGHKHEVVKTLIELGVEIPLDTHRPG